MTNNFERILGRGGFGMVYHGYVNGTEQVAVKVVSQGSDQGHKQFKAEVLVKHTIFYHVLLDMNHLFQLFVFFSFVLVY